MNTDEIIAGATVRTDDDGQPIIEMATCGTCGRTWNDAAISSITPTPAGRCPWEDEHGDDALETEIGLSRLLSLDPHKQERGDTVDAPSYQLYVNEESTIKVEIWPDQPDGRTVVCWVATRDHRSDMWGPPERCAEKEMASKPESLIEQSKHLPDPLGGGDPYHDADRR